MGRDSPPQPQWKNSPFSKNITIQRKRKLTVTADAVGSYQAALRIMSCPKKTAAAAAVMRSDVSLPPTVIT